MVTTLDGIPADLIDGHAWAAIVEITDDLDDLDDLDHFDDDMFGEAEATPATSYHTKEANAPVWWLDTEYRPFLQQRYAKVGGNNHIPILGIGTIKLYPIIRNKTHEILITG
ncbi:hypothetical protein HK104_010463, partial [Borealophlyctis nickersoniae]